jgi:hypothetical protein
MRVVAAVLEGTLLPAPVEQPARDLLERSLVLGNELVFLRPALDHVARGDHQVGVAAARGTRPVVELAHPLVEGRPPPADALQAEHVVTPVQDAELEPLLDNRLQADATLLVQAVDRVVLRRLGHLVSILVQVFAGGAVPAVASLLELAGGEAIWVLEEQVDDLVVIILGILQVLFVEDALA